MMRCARVKELLYDFLTHRLDGKTHHRVEEHLMACKHCQVEQRELEETISLLDQWKPPEISPTIEDQIISRIKKRMAEKPESRVKTIIDRVFRPYSIKITLEGLAVMAIILLSLTIYKGYYPGKFHEAEKAVKELEIKFFEVKNPIIIETKDIDPALELVKNLIQNHHGSLLQTIWMDGGVKVTFSLKKEEESSLFDEFHRLGRVQMEKEGYKDGKGNIVVLLKKDRG